MKFKYLAIGLMMLFCLNVYGQQNKTVPMTVQSQKTEVQVLEETVSLLQAENQAMQKQLESMEKEIELYRGDVRNKVAELDEAQSRWLVRLSIVITAIMTILGLGVPLIMNNKNEKAMEVMLKNVEKEANSAKQQATSVAAQVRIATEQANKAEGAYKQMQSQVNSVTVQVTSASKQAQIAKEQAQKAEEANKQMQSQVDSVTEQVTSASEQARIATGQAKQAKQALAEIEDLKKHVDAIEKKINKDVAVVIEAAKEAEKSSKISQLFAQAAEEKDPLKAIEFITQAIVLKPDDPFAYNYRGNLKAQTSDAYSALSDYDMAILLDPEYAEAYYNRASCYRYLAIKEQDLELIAKAEADEKKAESLKKDKEQ